MYKRNVGVLGKMLSKIFQNPCFCFGHNLVISHLNGMILVGKEPKEVNLQMCRWYQKEKLTLRPLFFRLK